MDYVQLIYDGAKKQNLTIAEVRNLSFKQAAALAKVNISEKNYKFSYESAKRRAADRMAREEAAAAMEVKRASYQSKLRELPGESKATVKVDEDGNIKIHSAAVAVSL